MADLIDREVTLQLLDKSIELFDENTLQDRMSKNGLLIAKRIVSKQPTIEAEPVRHGRWILNSDENFVCNQCRHPQQIGAKDFCGKCGADMREEYADNGY